MARFPIQPLALLCFPQLFCSQVSGRIPEPQQVTFNATDFYTVLHWRKGSHTSKSTVYMVQYKMYREKQWNNKTECWKISRAFCDLTRETKDFMEPHFARVQALTPNGHSNWVLSEKFIPFWETAIGPPKIKLTPQARSILVKLLAPRTPFRGKNGSWVTLEKIYSDIEYLVEITSNPVDHRPELHTTTSTTLNIQNLKPRTTYCLRAQIKIPFFSKIGEYGGKRCVTTFEDI